ncbi:MAG: flippase-like domain-containing protein [Bacteroidetes bacterium]|jgi:uncharacterized protein (TIRG00374 family)|nr:flippase-like domain-containing protein [Bacteroidota bacterium]
MSDASSSEDANPSVASEAVDRSPSGGSASLSKIGLSLGLSLAVLLVIGYFTFDASTFWKLVRAMQPWPFVAALVLAISRTFFGGWRLHVVSRGRLTLMEGTRGQLAIDFFSNLTPSAIGGSPLATLYIAKDRGIRVGEATAFMLFSALLDQLWFAFSISVVLATSVVIDVIPPSIGDVGLWAFVAVFVGMLAWATLFAYATLFRPSLLERLANRIFSFRYLSRFHDRVMEEMHAFTQRAHALRTQPPAFYLKGVVLTSGVWIGRFALVVFIIWSVFPTFDKLLVFLRTIAMTMSSLVLPTPGGSGGLEGLYALFIGPLIPEALVAPTLLAWRVLGYYIFLALGAYLFLHQIQQIRASSNDGDAASSSTGRPSAASPSVPSSSTE